MGWDDSRKHVYLIQECQDRNRNPNLPEFWNHEKYKVWDTGDLR